jgi:hypothetical protein
MPGFSSGVAAVVSAALTVSAATTGESFFERRVDRI